MKRSELLTRIIIVAAVLGAVGLPLLFWARTPLIHARIPEAGGWNPDLLLAKVGVPLHLRLISDDVMHGFAVGQMDMESVDVLPGKVTDLTILFDKPGTYTFYCTRWCGVNHWRMRGTIEVGGPGSTHELASAPLYVTLGLDIDAPHDSPSVPTQRPSALRGQQLTADQPIPQLEDTDFYRTHSPYQTFEELGSTSLTETERWDIVALIWQSNTTPEALANGARLFAQNCAACHGETGAGDGVFADDVAAAGESSAQAMAGSDAMTMQAPANFADPKRILGASPALLQGKILRGGMGTGMPMWGSIFTEAQIWDLVAYIYSLTFQYH
jgi:mono/diheme cytochrome c family protein